MYTRQSKIVMFFIILTLICGLLTGCFEEELFEEMNETEIQLDHPSILPDWNDGEYHDYYETMDLLNEFQIEYHDLVNVFSLGNSVLGKDIWCIRITNENNNQAKLSCFIDGCIHGCEWEAGEACLYLAEYLLINFDKNESSTDILNTTEVYIVPLVNPDGRQIDHRFNDNGIDLNRNFDIDFGRFRGGSIALGKLFNRIKITHIEFPRLSKWIPNFPPYVTNSGRRPFSEPETQAIRDFSQTLNKNDLSFYITCHTAGHCIIGPWIAFKPPHKIKQNELSIISHIEEWINQNTEYTNYRSGEGIVFKGEEFYASGLSSDWFFKEYHIPSFTFEILSEDYEMWMGQGKHDNLVHWMKTTLPVFMYLIVNIENLHNWEIPDIDPFLPEGIPPEPLH